MVRRLLVRVGVAVPRRLKLAEEEALHRRWEVEEALHKRREVEEALLQILVAVEVARVSPQPALRKHMLFSLFRVNEWFKAWFACRTLFVILADLDALIDVFLLKGTGDDDEVVLGQSARHPEIFGNHLPLPQKDSRAQ